MNTKPASDPDTLRTVRHKHLRQTSLATVIAAAVIFPVALVLYSWATVTCMGGTSGIGWCDVFSASPLLGIILSIVAYGFVMWIINNLGHESLYKTQGALPASRYAWKHAKLGYKELDEGHHHLVRRVHRVSSIATAGVAAYVSFMLFEADTPANLAVAAVTYAIFELLNWKTYTKIMQEAEQLAKRGS
jgi:hypothetical protein